jgi:cytochrome c553
MRKPNLLRHAGPLLLAGVAVVAQAQDAAAPLALRSLAATCAQCHGTDGQPVAGSIVPALAGRQEAELAERLSAFKSGTRPSTVMAQIARGYSDAQLRRLAAYFATQPR